MYFSFLEDKCLGPPVLTQRFLGLEQTVAKFNALVFFDFTEFFKFAHLYQLRTATCLSPNFEISRPDT